MTRERNIAEIENNQDHTGISNKINNVVNYNRSSLVAMEIRNKFMDYFYSENGSIYWQNKYLV